MRQASWEEMFQAAQLPERPQPKPWWSRLMIFSWEELITLLIVMIAFVTVVQSINNADWVAEMPSLYQIAFLGLGLGLVLSRFHVNELLLHLVALVIGIGGVILTSTSSLDGSVATRTEELVDRVRFWGEALFSGGISNDNLPFVLLVVGLTFLMAYLSAWSLFRWYNAWLALIPAGLALLTNISYLPGQRSFSLLIYLFCAILLVARTYVLRKEREWRKARTEYPEMISLHVLNVTVWISLGLLAFAWILPIGSGSGALYSLWDKATSPLTAPLNDLGRVFSSIDSKKGGTVHRFGSTLPLQGEISLGGGEVMQVTANETGFLRAQSYDFYTAQGWKIGSTSQISSTPWPASKALQTIDDARRQFRRAVQTTVITSKEAPVIVSAGQPIAVNIDSRVVFGPDQVDVTSIRPPNRLSEGAQYRVDSTVSNATVSRLRTAPTVYPAWVTNTYLQLPADYSRQVTAKAREVTAGHDNPYDRATAIEAYLRTLGVDTKINPAPSRRDSVEYFLFTLGRGYFDYHASAMVVMLRSLGIPARLAVGYIIRPGDRMPDTSTYIVSEANAYAWPEVYFPGLGWVEFNPTPNEPRISRSGSDDQEFFNGIEEELLEEPGLPSDDVMPVDPAATAIDNLQTNEGSNLVGRIILTVLIAIVGLTALGAGLFQYSWQRGLGGLDYPVQVWEKTMRLARWARIRPAPQDTPRDITSRLHRELPEVQDLDYMSEAFLRSRYGQKQLEPAEKDRLAAVWKNVRNTLLQRLLRWK